VRWLKERGLDARAVATRFEGERDDVAVDAMDTVDAPDDTAAGSAHVEGAPEGAS
jgi:hypothetical protein